MVITVSNCSISVFPLIRMCTLYQALSVTHKIIKYNPLLKEWRIMDNEMEGAFMAFVWSGWGKLENTCWNSRPQVETWTVCFPCICAEQGCYLLEILFHVSCQTVQIKIHGSVAAATHAHDSQKIVWVLWEVMLCGLICIGTGLHGVVSQRSAVVSTSNIWFK